MVKLSKKKVNFLCVIISLLICINLLVAVFAIVLNKNEISDVAKTQVNNSISNDVVASIEKDLSKRGTTVIEVLDKQINAYSELLETSNKEEEKEIFEKINILEDTKQYFTSCEDNVNNVSTCAYSEKSTDCGLSPNCTCTNENFATNKPCDSCKEFKEVRAQVTIIASLFETRGWLLAADLMMHNLSNKELDSDYWPVRGSSIAQSEQIKEIADNNNLTGDYSLDSPGNMNGLLENTIEGDVYNALGSFYYSKKYIREDTNGKQIVSIDIFDRYDWGEKKYGDEVADSLLAVLYKAEQIGVVTPFYTRITLTVSGNAPFDWEYTDDGAEILNVNDEIEIAEIPAKLYDFRVKRNDGQPQAEVFITKIGDNAFKNKKNIKEVVFLDYKYSNDKGEEFIEPTQISRIGSFAFSGCSELIFIKNISEVTNIGDNAFKDCVKLKEINNLKSLQIIGDEAFYNCKELISINLPIISYLGSEAFAECSSLTEIIFGEESTIEIIKSKTFYNTSLSKFVIPNCIINIEEDAFWGTTITEFVGNANYLWQDNVLIKCNVSDASKKIAIYVNPTISEVIIPYEVAILTSKLLQDNSNIKTIDLNQVEYIGPNSFKNSSLENIINANNIIDCDISALYGTPWYEINASDYVILGKVLLKYTGSESVVILPSNIKRIGTDCFDNNVTTQVVLSEEISSVGRYAFKGLTALESIIFTTNIPPVLDGECFEDDVVLYVKESKLSEYKENICFILLANTISAKEITINFYDIDNNFIGSKTEFYGSKFDNYVDAPLIRGKDFCGWEHNGFQLKVNDMLDFYNNLDLRAIYEVAKYQLTIMGDNGEQQLVLEYGQELNVSIPEIEGKIFKGWFDKAVGGNLVVDATKQCVWDNLVDGNVLYPQYDLITYTITYDFVGADKVNTLPTEFTVDNPIFLSEIATPQKFGYLFKYWYNNSEKFSNTNGIFKDIVLVAEWEGVINFPAQTLTITDTIAIIDFTKAESYPEYYITLETSVVSATFVNRLSGEFKLSIIIKDRNSAILLGFQNFKYKAPNGDSVNAIDAKKADIYLSYYKSNRIVGGEGYYGSQSSLDATNGGCGIYANAVTLMAYDEKSTIDITGGAGGDGRSGADGENGKDGEKPPSGSIFKPIKGDNGEDGTDGQDGGNGGDGGYGIYAESKKINVTPNSNYFISGGNGGNGGSGGNGGNGGKGADDVSGNWFTGTGDPGDGGKGGNGGTNGVGGSGSQGTNCDSLNTSGGRNGLNGAIGFKGEGGKGGHHGTIGANGKNGKDGDFGRDGKVTDGPVGWESGALQDSQIQINSAVVDLPSAFSTDFFDNFLN